MNKTCYIFLLLTTILLTCIDTGHATGTATVEVSSSGKPLIKPPSSRKFKTLLSIDGAGTRNIIPVLVLMETERAIKLYWLEHPELLPSDVNVKTIDDFDINLADYFDCMTAYSAGTWITAYLASRGGQGADRAVLDDPAIVAKYGVIPSGSIAAMRVLFIEFSSTIYPIQTLDPENGIPLDATNPNAPGVSSALFPQTGLEQTLEMFMGNATLADCDTTFIGTAVELATQIGIFFVQNTLRDVPITSSARLGTRTEPRPVSAPRHFPDFVFDEGKDYYLVDVCAASSAAVVLHPAKNISSVGSNDVELTLIDGVIPLEAPALSAANLIAVETGSFNFEKIAVLSLGVGTADIDYSTFTNAGITQWSPALSGYVLGSGQKALNSLLDYIYYANPNTLPNQHLRIQRAVPITTEEGAALATAFDLSLIGMQEEIGKDVVEEYRPAINDFVNKFIFG